MLMQNFKPHVDLGITDAEQVALVKVLGMLERDEIRHAPIDPIRREYARKPRAVKNIGFNMQYVFGRTHCGTAACIAGSCDLLFGTKFSSANQLRDLPTHLEQLFCPTDITTAWSDITPAQAAAALRSYLTTGEANWDEAISTPPRPMMAPPPDQTQVHPETT